MLTSVALDFRNAPVSVRERFHLSDARVAALFSAPPSPLVRELALVATCNRVELYAWSGTGDAAESGAASHELVRRWAGDEHQHADALDGLVLRRTNGDAAGHLMRVASGLESQVLGDAQILGQVRAAYRQAIDAGSVGPGLHRLFGTALHAAKRVKHETGLVGGRHSVGAEAAALAARRHGPLARRRCVVIGCGKTGERAARQLVKLGAADLVLINRTPARAQQLARDLWGRAATFDRLHREVASADIAIVATSAEQPPIRAASLRFCREMAAASERPLVLIDLSIPRNIEPEVAGLPNITLLDLDALHPPLQEAEALRQAAVPRAEAIVAEELAAWQSWVRTWQVRSALEPLQQALTDVCRRELAWAGSHAGADLDRAAQRIVAKLMARPMIALRHAAARGESVDEVSEALTTLFGHVAASAAAEAE